MLFDPVMMGEDVGNKTKAMLWRNDLRLYVWQHRSHNCDKCHKPLKNGFDLHEGIVSRQDVRGWRYPWKAFIFSELNCVCLCFDCNRNNSPSRQAMWELQVTRYGEEVMKEWYCGLPFRNGVPRRFWNE